MCGKYSLTKFLSIVLRAEIVATFGSKIVTISARNTIKKFARLFFPYFTTFRHQILEFYYTVLLKGSFREFCFLFRFA